MADPVLAVHALTKRFGALVAVDRLDLTVPGGEIFGLLGPNGAGKTTTIRMICGEIAPDGGRILFHGRPLRATVDDRVRVGLCPQEIVLWEKLSCRAQLEFMAQMYGLSAPRARRRADRLLDDLDLAEKRNVLAGTLSGGLRRRLNLALALVHEPELVVLDEPEAGLDPQSRVRVRDFIRSLAARSTVLLTTHDMAEADRLCDRLAIIDHGRLVATGNPEELKRRLGDGEVIELRFTSHPGADDEVAARALAGLANLRVRHAPGLLTVHNLAGVDPSPPTPGAAAVLPDVLARLAHENVTPDEVRLRAASLEDVFLKLTEGAAR